FSHLNSGSFVFLSSLGSLSRLLFLLEDCVSPLLLDIVLLFQCKLLKFRLGRKDQCTRVTSADDLYHNCKALTSSKSCCCFGGKGAGWRPFTQNSQRISDAVRKSEMV